VKKFLILALTMILALGLMGGSFAYFSDTETSTGNTFTAGTLDLQVVSPYGGQPYGGFPPTQTYNGSNIPGINLSNVAPGDPPIVWRMHVNNIGSINGMLSIHFNVIADYENTLEESEVDLGDTGPLGEMGDNLIVKVYYQDESQWPNNLHLVTSGTLNSLHCQVIPLGALNGENNPASTDGKDVVLKFELPSSATSICQSDSIDFDIDLILNQIP
jgi:predicted ribosomally synthesized peptide with SipW-like signal peptide